jgi:hypothetical protein
MHVNVNVNVMHIQNERHWQLKRMSADGTSVHYSPLAAYSSTDVCFTFFTQYCVLLPLTYGECFVC